MHFTKSQIEEIAKRLAVITKRDSEFPDVVLPLDNTERVPLIQYLPIVQDYENRLLSLADLRSLVLADTDQTSIGCLLTVNCSTPGATIKINGTVRSTYAAYYGEIVDVMISAEDYDTWYDVVTMTQDHTISVALNSLGKPLDVSLVNKGTYYTLTVNGVSVDLYSKEQVDALIAGGTSPDTPDTPEDAYLYFSEPTLTLSAEGILDTSISVKANIPWVLSMGGLPNEQSDAHDQSASTAVNIYPTTINMRVGDTTEIKEI